MFGEKKSAVCRPSWEISFFMFSEKNVQFIGLRGKGSAQQIKTLNNV